MKLIAAALVYPVPLCLIPGLAGILMLWLNWHDKVGKILVTASVGLLLLFTAVDVGGLALRRLERTHPPLTGQRLHRLTEQEAGDPVICVLGTGFAPSTSRPFNSQIDTGFLARLTEGARLWRVFPESKILVSIGGPAAVARKEAFLDRWAGLMGISREEVQLITGARNTTGEAVAMKEIAADRTVIVVTAASHMPRAVGAFHRHGMVVSAAPCDYYTPAPGNRHPILRLPGPGGLFRLERATYEVLALCRDWVRGWGRREEPQHPSTPATGR